MAAKRISSVKLRNPWAFMTVLSSAACEWFLIFMLFVDAVLSYLLTKFAHFCDLQTPCPLCSRIEHVFGKNRHGYYWSLLCYNHREEISSSVYCHIHSKLADVHAMCQDCLLSFARRSKSKSESCRLLLAKMGMDIDESGLKTLMNKRFIADSSGPRNCSCCNRLLKAKSKAQRLLQGTPIGYGASKANVKPPLPRLPGRSRFSHRDSLKRIRDKLSRPTAPPLGGNTGVDPLSHVGYTELKISSDTESEFPFSDDDDGPSAVHGNDIRTEPEIQRDLQNLPKVSLADNSSPGNQNHQTFEPLPSFLDQHVQPELTEANNVSYLESGAFEKHGFQELNWPQYNQKSSTSGLPELVSLDELHLAEHPKLSASFPQPSDLAVKISKKSDVTGTNENGSISVADASNPSMSNNMSSTVTFTSTNEERRESGMLAEPLRTNDSWRTEEAMESPPQISSSDMNLSPKGTSPRVPGNDDELQTSGASGASGADAVDMIQMAAALERHDSGHESVDGITVKEIEGETILDRLRRQVEYDKRCMKALFKELEEERGAAAIAANQAMAMITRLQEEKAALHMEALQYLRMMEEQAEYDMEALEKANDLLSDREKEVQDLEAELEIYRNNILDKPLVDDPHNGTCSEKVESKMANNCLTAHFQNDPTATDDSKSTDILKDSHLLERLSSPELDFEGEKLYISRCLEKLEKKFHKISRNELVLNLAIGEYAEKVVKEVDDGEELGDDIQTQITHHNRGNGLSLQKDFCASNGNPSKEMSADLVDENHLVYDESEHLDVVQDRLFADGGEIKLDSFKGDITDLKLRLEALETDRDILKHALNSLHSGNDGLQFIQEIAHQLQELRKIEFKDSCLSTP